MTFFNQYMVLAYLARGNFGKVYLCLNTADHRLYAVKVCTTCRSTPRPAQCARPLCSFQHFQHVRFDARFVPTAAGTKRTRLVMSADLGCHSIQAGEVMTVQSKQKPRLVHVKQLPVGLSRHYSTSSFA